jgi:hypothetical protein
MHRTSDSLSHPPSAAEPVARTPCSSEEARPCPGSKSILYSLLVAVALLTLALAAAANPASASNGMKLGIFDDAATIGAPDSTFPVLQSLDVQVVRMELVWGGTNGVANKQPAEPTDPTDPAYDWSAYDRAIESANAAGIQVFLTIVGTPGWANGDQGPQRPPRSFAALRDFAYAAARRYSGTMLDTATGFILPRVTMWLAWNEPNNPVFLQPQFTHVHGKWQMTSAVAYAQICNSVYDGVHAAGGPEQVACGATAPRGYNDPNAPRQSSSPLAFLRAVKKAGLRTFDAWAHHPYYGSPSQTPTTRNVGSHTVGFGNIDVLINELTRLYGPKHLWITEYGYQTRPPDMFFGVSWTKQAEYLREAYEIARANPRIDLFTWFLLDDNTSLNGWQSGLRTATGQDKPAFAVFAKLRAGSV